MTQPKQAKEALGECEKKFFEALQECPLAVTLTSAIDHRYIEINHTFERITGWNRDEVIGRTPFDIDIWVDPIQRADFVRRLLSGGTARNIDVRARMKNREVRIGVGFGALIEINGETCVLSLIEDVTDVKRAEEARQAEVATLSSLARRLIQAHDEERTRLARELHDQVDRLLLLSVDLDRLQQNRPESPAEVTQEIEGARQQIEDIVMDIQVLSNRLHSSKLEYLGLKAAAANFCKELSDQKKVEIEFVSEGITNNPPQAVAFCLFRVLQEVLQMAVNRSGSPGLQVSLRGGSTEFHLTVRDSGIGSDLQDASEGSGLALSVIRERLKLVGGELSIKFQPGRGTTIQVRVPLHSIN